MVEKPFFSIAIPTYEMGGYGEEFLTNSLSILSKQTFKDFEVIVSDHSQNDIIKDLCDRWSEILEIKYYRNTHKIGGSSPNINNAINHSNGKWIKILFQDDFLFSKDSLELLKNHIGKNKDKIWFATGCEHSNDGSTFYRPFYPSWTNDIHLGNNRISSPSVITIKNNSDKCYFDENLIWLMDVDFYKKMYINYGEPSYLNVINVVNRTWGNSVSNTLTQERKNKEVKLMFDKYR